MILQKYLEVNMKCNFKILIPARGGSKRIPNKNIIDVNGKPLLAYSIETAKKLTDEVYVSTDSKKISAVAKEYGAMVVERPENIGTDTSKTEEAVKHFLDEEKTEIIVVMQATTPLVTNKHISEGIEMMNRFDSVISVTNEKGFYWDSYGEPVNFIPGSRPRTQDMLPWYKENGAFYITKTESFIKTNSLYSGKVGFVEMASEDSVDIDDKEDLKRLKNYIKSFTD